VPERVPVKVRSLTAGDVVSVAGPETVLPVWVADHVRRNALPPPEPDPTIPDHVPERSIVVDGVID
jgi:hypothetical protein